MKVLVINCGSSSLKYQLIDMDGEKVLYQGYHPGDLPHSHRGFCRGREEDDHRCRQVHQ